MTTFLLRVLFLQNSTDCIRVESTHLKGVCSFFSSPEPKSPGELIV